MGLLDKIFGNYSEKEIKRIMPLQQRVLDLENEISPLSDSELKAKTTEFKQRLNEGETLDDILPEAFAVCREAAWRVLGMKHFPVQILGGIILHQGRISEMKTGEGKTLVATLPAYLNALVGKGVHIVTVNDYLAKRDSEWMGKLYRILGDEAVSDVFAYLEDVEDYITELDNEKAADIIEEMDADYAIDVLSELTEERREDIISLIEPEAQADIKLIDSYDEDKIGSRMTTNYIAITKSSTVKQAMRSLINQAADNDNISTIYAIEEDETFYGAIELRDLVIARETTHFTFSWALIC